MLYSHATVMEWGKHQAEIQKSACDRKKNTLKIILFKYRNV